MTHSQRYSKYLSLIKINEIFLFSTLNWLNSEFLKYISSALLQRQSFKGYLRKSGMINCYLPVISQLGESWKENCERTLNSHFTRTQPEHCQKNMLLEAYIILNMENPEELFMYMFFWCYGNASPRKRLTTEMPLKKTDS